MTYIVLLSLLAAIPSFLMLPFMGSEGISEIGEMISDVFHDLTRLIF